ncbi:MAG: SAM-dependent chlorinase/fluorinase [Actinomycetota bacterium]
MAAAAARQVRFDCITFLSDYGLSDEFVAVCKGVIRGIAPRVEILDISHSIEPFDLRHAAGVLARSVAYMPAAVHLAIVDPTVGSARRSVIVLSRDGSVFVGPDNGLLTGALAARGGPEEAWEIANPALISAEVSGTFHGRDIFAPAAAHAAMGYPLDEFGPPVSVETLERPAEPRVLDHGDHLHCEVLGVDRFGNAQLSVRAEVLSEVLGVQPGEPLDVLIGSQGYQLRWFDHFSAAGVGDRLVVTDSSGHAALAVNLGSFAGAAGIEAGDRVVLGRPERQS